MGFQIAHQMTQGKLGSRVRALWLNNQRIQEGKESRRCGFRGRTGQASCLSSSLGEMEDIKKADHAIDAGIDIRYMVGRQPQSGQRALGEE